MLVQQGHTVLLHGRSRDKLAVAKKQLSAVNTEATIETFLADLSILEEVKMFSASVRKTHNQLDVLINNAGVYVVSETISADNLDVRFVVNTIAPYLLTKELLPILKHNSRVINLSSAAQSSLEANELTTPSKLSDSSVYAKSKLALTMWSHQLARLGGENGPAFIAINPASMLGSKMVQQAYGVAGGKLEIGAEILVRAALSDEFKDASGKYFDNDIGLFTSPHRDALDPVKASRIIEVIESILTANQ